MADPKPSSPYVITAEDINEKTGPLFINAQNGNVGVYTPTKKKLYVQPWKDRLNSDIGIPSTNPARVFIVQGDHYKEYAGPGGPLTLFRKPQTAAERQALALGDPSARRPLHASLTAGNRGGDQVPAPAALPSPVHASVAGAAGGDDGKKGVPAADPGDAETESESETAPAGTVTTPGSENPPAKGSVKSGANRSLPKATVH